jgi:hypothetical protein
MPRALDDFLYLVAPRLSACPDAIMRTGVREACIAFCERTQLLVGSTTVTTVANQPGYQMTGDVMRILAVKRSEQTLVASTRIIFEDEGLDTITGEPSDYYLDGNRKLVLGPIPEAVETLTVRFSARPLPDAATVDDALFDDWRNGIAAGARVWVRQHHQAWFNPAEEAIDDEMFESAIAKANIRRAKGGTNRPIRTRGTYF